MFPFSLIIIKNRIQETGWVAAFQTGYAWPTDREGEKSHSAQNHRGPEQRRAQRAEKERRGLAVLTCGSCWKSWPGSLQSALVWSPRCCGCSCCPSMPTCQALLDLRAVSRESHQHTSNVHWDTVHPLPPSSNACNSPNQSKAEPTAPEQQLPGEDEPKRKHVCMQADRREHSTRARCASAPEGAGQEQLHHKHYGCNFIVRNTAVYSLSGTPQKT